MGRKSRSTRSPVNETSEVSIEEERRTRNSLGDGSSESYLRKRDGKAASLSPSHRRRSSRKRNLNYSNFDTDWILTDKVIRHREEEKHYETKSNPSSPRKYTELQWSPSPSGRR